MAQAEPLRVQIEPSPELNRLIRDFEKAALLMQDAAQSVHDAARSTAAGARSRR